ncbi:hypothetical protein [Paractinoplanes durhamensis]|uniref:Uncharacterized protein n=1 Tax=Paractinoplanes durhamensis TaxID=113563 RepID=A0ABQ3YRG0_9ACTN|nr:hypothetical protein [Actinoplanes durhamensis]GIE00176.1 hypothetical protein Adu01nite_15260 [Actinoplanes durhamensis]
MSVRNRILSLLAVVLLGAGVVAGTNGPAAAASPASDHVMTVLGAGPFRMGISLERLAAAGLISWSTDPDGTGAQLAGSGGTWGGELVLTFHHGALIVIETDTGSVRTAAGARVGMSFGDVEAIYHGYGELITNDQGRTAYVVPIGPMVMLFGDHPIRAGVGSIQAGPSRIVLDAFLNGA